LKADVIKNAADNAKNGTASALPSSGGSSKGRANEMGWQNRAALFMENHPVRAPQGSCGWFRTTQKNEAAFIIIFERRSEKEKQSRLRSALFPPLAGIWSLVRVLFFYLFL
jgi:hypothetical protein